MVIGGRVAGCAGSCGRALIKAKINSNTSPPAEAEGFARHAPVLRRYFRKRVPVDHVDDLVQEVFLNMQARRAGSSIENLEGYLFAVAANVLIRYRSAARRTTPVPFDSDPDETGPSDSLSPERLLLGNEALRRAIAVLEDLPMRTRDILLLHRFEEMTYAEIARRLGISVSAVEKHIMAALRRLKAATKDET